MGGGSGIMAVTTPLFRPTGLPELGLNAAPPPPPGGPGSVLKTWCFDAGTMGMTRETVTSNTIDFVHYTDDGIKDCTCTTANGCVRFLGPGLPSAQGSSQAAYRSSTGETWETWGVPAGATVTSVQLVCWAKRDSGPSGANQTTKLELMDSAGAINTIVASPLYITNPFDHFTEWHLFGASTAQAVLSGKSASNTDVRLKISMGMQIGPAIDMRVDAIELQINYTVSAGVTNPYGVAGALAWYKADVGTFQDSAMTTPATADAAPVGGWQDLTGLTHNQLQATAGARPTLRLAQKNGLPALRFDGVDDVLKSGAFAWPQPFTIFLVFKNTTFINNASILAADTGIQPIVYQRTSGGSGITLVSNATSLNETAFGADITTWNIAVFSMQTTPSAEGRVKKNAGAGVANGGMGSAGMGGLWIGASGPGGLNSFSAVDIGEIIGYNTVLTAPQQTTVLNALNARWAIY